MTHRELVIKAGKWLNSRCQLVVTEPISHSSEIPDAIGWSFNGNSYLVECKVTRSDFQGDKHKPHRNPGKGMGNFRYYACPKGLIGKDELPDGWGLIETSGSGMRQTHWTKRMEADLVSERKLLVSVGRYVALPHYAITHHPAINESIIHNN